MGIKLEPIFTMTMQERSNKYKLVMEFKFIKDLDDGKIFAKTRHANVDLNIGNLA
jgi:hypothetical protein